MKKVLVTGAKGQLGTEMVRKLSRDYQVIALDRVSLDVTNIGEVLKQVNRYKPDIIIHTAAYTHVDHAEQDQETAFLVNAYGARNMAIASEKIGAKLVYISTDYVFDGKSYVPNSEFDKPNPINVYGKSKWVGEEMVRTFSKQFFIVRTSWLYGMNGSNFVKTLMNLGQQKKEIPVVIDQIGSPTYATDLAQFIQELILTEKYGIYHGSNIGECSWFELAQTIMELTSSPVKIIPITTRDLNRPAPRPHYSVLDNMALHLNGFTPLRPWKDALEEFIHKNKVE